MKIARSCLAFFLSLSLLGQAEVRAELPSFMISVVPDLESVSETGASGEDLTGEGLRNASSETSAENSAEDPLRLYALSAVLMDGDSGRVLYSREGETPRPMASTTKVMTCILALENAPGDDYVQVSANAAAQPDVQLNIQEGEQYYLEDLLYSLMLRSHNDVAVAVAEHVGGSVEGFARMMNQKARDLGCRDTHFITPNGLDAEDSGGEHHTTARDLALIMRYAIKNETFLRITQTRDYSFSDITGKRRFSIHNANALLDMTEGVLSGKTGYTGNAGYCYVCALKREDKTFIIALLGCGWPSHKTYKWEDTMTLLEYGDSCFHYKTIWKEPVLSKVRVENGVTPSSPLRETIYLEGIPAVSPEIQKKKILMNDQEEIQIKVNMPASIAAPVAQGEEIGTISCMLGEEILCSVPVLAEKSVRKRTYQWCVDRVFHNFFH